MAVSPEMASGERGDALRFHRSVVPRAAGATPVRRRQRRPRPHLSNVEAHVSADSARGRLAPSPTGGLHVGNVRTLLLAWLSVRAAGGTVILRIEDIDRARCRPEYIEQLIDDLRWLGLAWDEGPPDAAPHGPYEQSRRLPLYENALRRLIVAGYAFPCTCSRADLAGAASAPHDGGDPPYPGICHDRYPDAATAQARSGRPPAWRFDGRRSPVMPWRDQFRPNEAAPEAVDSFVLWRADGVPSYHLAVVVDDLAMAVTEVVRGDDLAASTPRQLALISALGGTPPSYRHVPLVLDQDGRRLAKRAGATAVAELRRLGVQPQRLIGLLAHGAGLLDRPAPAAPADLIGDFSWEKVPRPPVRITDTALLTLIER